MRKISDLDIKKGDSVLLRLDLNVPTNDKGDITNFFRIDESVTTIKDLQSLDAKVVILAHKEDGDLEKVFQYLKLKISNLEFIKLPEMGKYGELKKVIGASALGTVFLLDNIRKDKREKSKDETERNDLAKELASLGVFYVNDAFSASHRDHASITSLPKFFPGKSTLGPKFIEEIEKLSLALTPKHPLFLLVGGAKFDTKLPMIEKFLKIADKIFVGGALAHSFWKNSGNELGQSLIDNEVTLSQDVLHSPKIILPIDVMIENKSIVAPNELGPDNKILDFGPKTLTEILNIAKNSETIVWNGPVDYYEGGFDWGTKELIEEFSKMSEKNIILGGGDTVTEIDRVKKEKPGIHFTHVSTGGGAMIEFLSNGTLPGIEAIV